jgi:hypothetical protein
MKTYLIEKLKTLRQLFVMRSFCKWNKTLEGYDLQINEKCRTLIDEINAA